MTLDSFNLKRITLVKIDVEGLEWRVLRGALTTLFHSRPVLQVEIERRHSQFNYEMIIELMQSIQYSGFFYQSGLKPIRMFNFEEHQNIDSLNKHDGGYINNFIFFCNEKISLGHYRKLHFHEKCQIAASSVPYYTPIA